MEYAIALILCGIILIVDGLGSIYIYRKQTLKEHIPRVVRSAIGVGLIVLSLWF